NVKIAEDKQITERFSKAIEQLGSEKIEVRLGAIYTLERIAKDSPKDHWTIMEILTAFVRHNDAVEEEDNLSGANLFGANLSGANLKNTKGLTPEQVKSAINYQNAEYDEDFRAQLDLPSQ
uniref:pentapeptide repeat-containing protein n=1 Tax=Calothrix rhizosoleniae TaxID=888997 RepID=UPI001177ECCC